MTIRILHVIGSLGRGGAERQLVDVVCNSSRAEYAHTVCYLQPSDAFAEEIRNAGHTVVGLNLSGKRPWIAAAACLVPIMRSQRPDVIHSWLYDANISARLARASVGNVPVVTSLQSADYEPATIRAANWPTRKVWGLRWLDKVSARWSRPVFVACSHFVERSARQQLGIPASRIHVIYNSVNPRTLLCEPDEPRRLRQSLRIPEDGVVFVDVARLDAPKGLLYLLHAFRQVLAQAPRAYLALVGDGPLAPELRLLASELKLQEHVRFLGVRRDVGACLEMADVFTFPTLFEGFGIALVEAMFKGLPCIASRVGPLPEVIREGETGLLVTPGSVAELAAAMLSLYSDANQRRSLGARGQQDALQRFHSDKIIPQWHDLYGRLARKARASEAS